MLSIPKDFDRFFLMIFALSPAGLVVPAAAGRAGRKRAG
jgi:hypothetical protein